MARRNPCWRQYGIANRQRVTFFTAFRLRAKLAESNLGQPLRGLVAGLIRQCKLFSDRGLAAGRVARSRDEPARNQHLCC
jgi:hypothetical protein